ncbi:MAG: hypothetical protein OER96_10120 [Gammaproteobacteria bacterium]|nr:hypothetical protein [Gammaproteobacteria bacterium]
MAAKTHRSAKNKSVFNGFNGQYLQPQNGANRDLCGHRNKAKTEVDHDDISNSEWIHEWVEQMHKTRPAWQMIERYKEDLWLRRQLTDVC